MNNLLKALNIEVEKPFRVGNERKIYKFDEDCRLYVLDNDHWEIARQDLPLKWLRDNKTLKARQEPSFDVDGFLRENDLWEGKPFLIKYGDYRDKVIKYEKPWFVYRKKDETGWHHFDADKLIEFKKHIKPLYYEPKTGEKYYYVDIETGYIGCDDWYDVERDRKRYNKGLVCKHEKTANELAWFVQAFYLAREDAGIIDKGGIYG